jgi:hypothetical protein
MEPLIIEASKSTPRIEFDQSKGIFKIEGKSLPENVMHFYTPVIDWFQKYLESPNPETILDIQLEYFNTASSKIIFDIIKLLKAPAANGIDVKVQWRHHEDDEDNLEVGQDYASLVNVPFIFTPYTG